MQQELAAESLAVPVSIIGINPPGLDSGDSLISAGRTIPWLQEEPGGDDPWTDWNVTYRDVVILDSSNVLVDVYNLTEHDLSSPANRDALKAKLRAAGTR
jgi:hypothetical protein